MPRGQLAQCDDNLLSALYSFPGDWLSDRLGYKRALLLFTHDAMVGCSWLPTTTLGGAHVEQGGFDFHAALRSGRAAPEQAADLDRIIAEEEKHKKKLGIMRSYWG